MSAAEHAEATQEQAVAAWIGYLHDLRITRLIGALQAQDKNLAAALGSLEAAERDVENLIASGRGFTRGMHGFIAEAAETGIRNARDQVHGKTASTIWIDANTAIDLIRDGVPVQQKFSAAGHRFSLPACQMHLQKYPDFLKDGGKYQIPRDFYETVQSLLKLDEHQAALLTSHGDGPSYSTWKYVQRFFSESPIEFSDLEPSVLTYDEVQAANIADTLQRENAAVQSADRDLRRTAETKNAPTVGEGLKVAGGAALAEGATSAALEIMRIVRGGTPLTQFSAKDWREVATATGHGSFRGGMRGASIYMLTNVLKTPAAAANAAFTAAIGIASAGYDLSHGTITEEEFLHRAQLASVDATICCISSTIGQTVIPIPILGAVIGGLAGSFAVRIAQQYLGKRETQLVTDLDRETKKWRSTLTEDEQVLLQRLDRQLLKHMELIETINAIDIGAAFDASIDLARASGVPDEKILDSPEMTAAYFLS